MKLGIGISIDVTQIDKSRIKTHTKKDGTVAKYIDLTTFIDLDNPDQYGQHGFISQTVTQEERSQNIQTPILGNCKVFYNDGTRAPSQSPAAQQAPAQFQDDNDIPF